MATYYEELGVAPDASPDDLRRAYRARVRRLHPDVRSGRQAGDEVAIRRLNEAWNVLRDPVRRARYDRTLGRYPTTVPGVTTVAGSEQYRAHFHRPRRVSPVVAILAVLIGLIVFTAYAAPAGRAPRVREADALVGLCLDRQPGFDAFVPCAEGPHDGRIVAVPSAASERCPAGTRRHDVAGRSQAVCLAGAVPAD